MITKDNVVILAAEYLKQDKTISIGGIQTYITKLIELLSDNFNIYVIQEADSEFEVKIIGAKVIGIKKGDNKARYAEEKILKGDDLLIFSTENILDVTKWKKNVVIQHGIYWDVTPSSVANSFIALRFPEIYQVLNLIRVFKKLKRFNKIVAVDYNFYNFYKVFFPNRAKNVNVIPNFSDRHFYAEKVEDKVKEEKIRILFARRFITIRGVDLLINSIEKLNTTGYKEKIEFIITGDGRGESELREIEKKYDNVSVLKTSYLEMPGLIKSCDISLVPSIGSEGTSLSLLESLAAGNVVLCTPCGGMSNIVIDGFNGFYCQPEKEDFFIKLKNIIDNFEHMYDVRKQGVETVKKGFSEQLWASRWMDYSKTLWESNN